MSVIIVKRIIVELGPSEIAKEKLEKGELDHLRDERTLIYTRETRKWIDSNKEGLFPSELQLIAALDKTRQGWNE